MLGILAMTCVAVLAALMVWAVWYGDRHADELRKDRLDAEAKRVQSAER